MLVTEGQARFLEKQWLSPDQAELLRDRLFLLIAHHLLDAETMLKRLLTRVELFFESR
jgi:hypothetical protein